MLFDHTKLTEDIVIEADSYWKADVLLKYLVDTNMADDDTRLMMKDRMESDDKYEHGLAVCFHTGGGYGWCYKGWYSTPYYKVVSFDDFEWGMSNPEGEISIDDSVMCSLLGCM